MSTSLIFFGIVVVAVVYGIGLYNNLVQVKHEVAKAWANIDVLLKTLGLSTYPRQNRPMFLSPEQAPLVGKEYSEATAAKLDDEVKELITARATGVRELLTNNRALLESVAAELLKEEVMESDAFYRLVEVHSIHQSYFLGVEGHRLGVFPSESGRELTISVARYA